MPNWQISENYCLIEVCQFDRVNLTEYSICKIGNKSSNLVNIN